MSGDYQSVNGLSLVPESQHTISLFIEVCTKFPYICICQFLKGFRIKQEARPVECLENFVSSLFIESREEILGITIQYDFEFLLYFHFGVIECCKVTQKFRNKETFSFDFAKMF